MSQANPLPRGRRRKDYEATPGQTVFGPADWLAFDALDVRVRAKAIGGLGFITLTTGFTVALSAEPAGFPTVTFAAGRTGGDIVRVEGARVHERTSDVTRAGSIQTAKLERELDKQAATLIEMRRDIEEVGEPAADLVEAVTRAEVARGGAETALGGAEAARGVAETAAAAAAALVGNVVLKVPQTLTEPEKAQVRDNIGAGTGSGAVPAGHIFGLSTANNGVDTQKDIDIAPGEAASDDATPALMKLTSSITKRLDANWVVGSGNGGLDTGSPANNTWYYVWLIMRSDTSVVDTLFSASSSAPTMPANYDRKRLIWAFRTNGSANIEQYIQIGDLCIWPATFTEVNAVAVTVITTYTLGYSPPLLGVRADLSLFLTNASAAGAARVFSAMLANAEYNVANGAAGSFGASDVTILVSGAGQIKAQNSSGSNALTVRSRGFRFPF